MNISKLESIIEELKLDSPILKVMDDPFYIVDINLDYIWINEKYRQRFEKPIEEILGRNYAEFHDPKPTEDFRTKVLEVLKTGSPTLYEHLSDRGDEGVFERKLQPYKGEYIMVTSRDITNRKKMEEELKLLSTKDPLTGLYNRRFFEEVLGKLDKSRKLPITVIIGDLDGLRLVNNAFGHEYGDRLLRNMANILQNCFRKGDIIARIGGDEYGIILPNTVYKGAEEFYQRVMDTCNNAERDPIPLSISLGIATKSDVTEDINAVRSKADQRMYKDKNLKGEQFHYDVISYLKEKLWNESYEDKEHAERLKDLVIRMGKYYNLDDSEMDSLSKCAELHDIGNVTVPKEILNKKDMLSQEEWLLIRGHAQNGYNIVKECNSLLNIAELIYTHHERWDGSGYPRGLRDGEIPFEARILAIADAYDAMTHDRPYKKAISHEEALYKIKKHAGTRFDLDIAKSFINIMSETVDNKVKSQ